MQHHFASAIQDESNKTESLLSQATVSHVVDPAPVPSPVLPSTTGQVEPDAVGYVRTVVPLPEYIVKYLSSNQLTEQDLFVRMNDILPGLIGYLPRWEMPSVTQGPQATGELLLTRRLLRNEEALSVSASSISELFSALHAVHTIDDFLEEKGVRSSFVPEQIEVIGEVVRVVFVAPPSQFPRPPAETRIFDINGLREELESRWRPTEP